MTNSYFNKNNKFNPAKADELGDKLGAVAGVALAPDARKKLYGFMTHVNDIAAPVYALGVTSALFVGGEIGGYIAVGTGVLGVVNTIANSFTNRLAKRNVTS